MALTPWYKVATPREDLREGRPLDASEFAVHLDQVRDGRAPAVYQQPVEFFERTYLTKNLASLAAEVSRRLSGIKVETSAVFNMATQFGGGKTHSLALLYHLARGGQEAAEWKGVRKLLRTAGVAEMPQAATAVFVGTEFDSIAGRGGTDGTPVRKTPWGEIAWQLGGAEALGVVAEHDASLTAPGGDVVSRILPADRPVLILLDELMNYVSRSRRSGLGGQLYSFLHNLSEVARSRDDAVLAVSIPASELEMTVEDQSDHERFKKLLDRLGKAVIMSVEAETAEIIRRRLFEWHGLHRDGLKTVGEYVEWLAAHRHQVPSWFPIDNARETLAASYPFHPSVLSVFERKWQALPRFQHTRGILRLLALWVSHAYVKGFKGAHKDPLITLGSAPLDDPTFRAAVFEQLGESRLEGAVTTDIVGKEHAHALRLDTEATAEVKKARLHRKVATSIFFESNGGQRQGEATLPEVRLAAAEPDLDIGNVEQSLEALVDTCYFLSAEKNRYRFSFKPNLNKLLADRRASVSANATRDRVRAEIQKVFALERGVVERIYFPKRTNQVPDRAALTLIVLPPESEAGDRNTVKLMETMAKVLGSSSITYKSALIWCVAEDGAMLSDEARKVLAWEDIEADTGMLRIDESQHRQLQENLKRAKRDLQEAVWRSYKTVFLLDETNALRKIDLGLVHSSAANSLVALILGRLRQEDLVVDGVSPNFLVRNWPPALPEWSTKAARDAFFASPKFPRLLNPDRVKQTISRGVEAGMLAYVVKEPSGGYEPFVFRETLNEADLEVTDDVFLITKDGAEAYMAQRESGVEPPPGTAPPAGTSHTGDKPGGEAGSETADPPELGATTETVSGFRWTGEITPQKWMNFYTKVLARFATADGLRLTLTADVQPEEGVSKAKVEETKVALRELGMVEDVEIVD
ncbi:MAG: ATP-binding protein [Gammaproteobacteria bacterium]|nr:ATP-binding protein [Gammaproteobacteria bacterium]